MMMTLDISHFRRGEPVLWKSAYQVIKFKHDVPVASARLSDADLPVSFSSNGNDRASYLYFDPMLVTKGAAANSLQLAVTMEGDEVLTAPLDVQIDLGTVQEKISEKKKFLASVLSDGAIDPDGIARLLSPEISDVKRKSDHVSAHDYGGIHDKMPILHTGIGIDVGSGVRQNPLWNMINLEIFDYPSTDIVSFGNRIPVKDNSFDFAICLAVLEHVPNPFEVAAEIERIVKPGGEILVGVPFLQHLHGYPHHYFNATTDGIEQLFSGSDIIEHFQNFSCHPIRTLRQVITDYFKGLHEMDPAAGKDFLDLKLRDIAKIEVSRDERFLNISESAKMQIAHANFSWMRVR